MKGINYILKIFIPYIVFFSLACNDESITVIKIPLPLQLWNVDIDVHEGSVGNTTAFTIIVEYNNYTNDSLFPRGAQEGVGMVKLSKDSSYFGRALKVGFFEPETCTDIPEDFGEDYPPTQCFGTAFLYLSNLEKGFKYFYYAELLVDTSARSPIHSFVLQ